MGQGVERGGGGVGRIRGDGCVRGTGYIAAVLKLRAVKPTGQLRQTGYNGNQVMHIFKLSLLLMMLGDSMV